MTSSFADFGSGCKIRGIAQSFMGVVGLQAYMVNDDDDEYFVDSFKISDSFNVKT